MLSKLLHHRTYIWRTSLADVRTQYAGSAMGVIWNVIQPMAMILIFWIIFGNLVARGRKDDVAPFAIIMCCTLLPWLSFSEVLARGTSTFVSKSGYLRRLPIPEQVFMAQTAMTGFIGLAISYSLLVVIAIALGVMPTWHWLLLPIPLTLLIVFAYGLALALGTVNAFIRDTAQIVPIALRLGFWAYPIVYPKEILPDWFRKLLPLNPVYAYLETIRNLFLDHHMPPNWRWVAMLVWTGTSLAFGFTVLRMLRSELRDVV